MLPKKKIENFVIFSLRIISTQPSSQLFFNTQKCMLYIRVIFVQVSFLLFPIIYKMATMMMKMILYLKKEPKMLISACYWMILSITCEFVSFNPNDNISFELISVEMMRWGVEHVTKKAIKILRTIRTCKYVSK